MSYAHRIECERLRHALSSAQQRIAELEAENEARDVNLAARVSAQDMRESLNIPMFEEEAQAAANGFNQCLLECAPIHESNRRMKRCIDEWLKELDAMHESTNHTHKRRKFWYECAEAAAGEPVAYYANGAYYHTLRAALKDNAEEITSLYAARPAALPPGVEHTMWETLDKMSCPTVYMQAAVKVIADAKALGLKPITLPHSWIDGEGVEIMRADEVRKLAKGFTVEGE